jgi:hypothetical protein
MATKYDDLHTGDERLERLLDLKEQLNLAMDMVDRDKLMLVQPILDPDDLKELDEIITGAISLINELKR